jgi:uncharacterized protein (TIGR03437 family)
MQKISRNFPALFLFFAATSLAQSGAGTRVYTVPDGLAFNVDGQHYTGPTTSFWPTGTKHVLEALVAQVGGLNVKSRYAFKSWQYVGGTMPGGAIVTVTADPALKEFFAVYSVQHALDIVFNTCTGTPECPIPGTVYVNDTPVTQTTELFLDAGSNVKLVAVPADGYVFDGWGQGDNQNIQGFLNTVSLLTPSIVRPRFLPARKVQLATIPAELDLFADRARVPTPSTLDWAFGSTHVIGAPTPQMDKHGAWWAFSKWSDGGAVDHTFVASSGGPLDALTATYVPATVVDLKTNPVGLPLKVDGRDNWPNFFFPWAAGEVHKIEAPLQQTDDKGHVWNFVAWSNGASRVQDFTVPLGEAPGSTIRVTANYAPVGHLLVSSTISGLSIKVDGADCGTPCDLQKPVGTIVKLSAPPSIALGDNARADFDGWPGSGSLATEWTVTLGADPVMPNLTYRRMNRLIAASTPADGAAWRIDPASPDGYYDALATVKLSVTAQPGYRFRRWNGDAAGTTPFTSVAMNTPRLVEAMLDRVPYIAPAGVQNAAGATPLAAVAPGSIVSIFGASFAPDVMVGPSAPLAQALGCVTVRIGDRLLPLFFVSPSQINFQMPDDVQPSDQRVVVSCEGLPDVQSMVTVDRNAPGLFQDANAVGAVVHEDGSAVSVNAPAKRGELLTMFGTGFGPTDRVRPFGFPLPADSTYSIVDAVSIQAGDATFGAERAFGAPGRVGVDAVQFRLPDGIAAGAVQLRVSVNGKDSNTVVLAVE